MMFSLIYVRRELSRRAGRTLLTVFGLAIGVGLVIVVTALSDGLHRAQDKALNPLASMGTDLLVTRSLPEHGEASQDDAKAMQAERTAADQAALIDLSKLGKPGDHFEHDFFLPATQFTFPAAKANDIGRLSGVASVATGLTLMARHREGTVPQIVAEFKVPARTIDISPPTGAELAATAECQQRLSQPTAEAMFRCLPERLRQVQLQQEVLRQVIAPPPTDIRSTVYTLGGVDVTSPGMGLLTAAQIVQGSFFSLDPQEEVVLDEAYAHQKRLDIGSTQVINGIRFKVVGLAQPPLGGMTSDVYVPLADLQQLSHRTGRINVIMIRVSNASQVERLSREVADAFPEARVASAKTLALQVTGSLVDVSRLTDRVGRVLALAVLAAAFGLAGVLTLSSVGRRVRELGTLRAVGWRTAWVVRQILGEALLLGLLGGIVGIGLGGVAALAVGRLAPSLDAIATPPAWAQPLARPPIHQTIRLEPRLDVVMMPLAAGLAIVGGLVAGTVGSISAARLRPGEALRYLE